MERKQWLSIKNKWVLFVVILVTYPILLIGYVGYTEYEHIITENFIVSVQKDVTNISAQLAEAIYNIEEFIWGIQQDEAIYDFATMHYNLLKAYDIEPSLIDDNTAIRQKYDHIMMGHFELKQEVSSYLKSLILSNQAVDIAAFQFAESGDFGYIESKNRATAFSDMLSFRDNKIFFNMNEVLKKTNTGYYVDEDKHIYIGRKMYYRSTGEHCVTIIFRLDTNQLFERYEEMLEDANEAVYILANGTTSLMEGGTLNQDDKKKLNQFVQMSPEAGILYKEETQEQAILYSTFKRYNLSIESGVYISKRMLMEEINRLYRFMILLCLSILPIMFMIAKKLYKELIKPIYILSDHMKRTEKGEIGIKIQSNRKDEFGYMFTCFNTMSQQLAYLVNRVYKEEIALKNAELKALRAQINPHFLYNTLEMINWKARMSGDQELSEMIEALSGIMEVNIDRREEHFIRIDEEIDYIKNYIFLIQKRFFGRVTFKLEIDQTLYKYKIPKLIVQPMLENALTHGLEVVGKGCIYICIEDIDETLHIKIEDDGAGIPLERFEWLKEQLRCADAKERVETRDKHGHIGMINVHKRIKLLYGKAYGVDIKSVEGKGTTVFMVLPKVE